MPWIPSRAEIARNFGKNVSLPAWRSKPQSQSEPLAPRGAPKELLEFFVRQAAANERRHAQILAGLATKEAVFKRAAAGFSRPGFRVENVVLQTRPQYFATGNLYLPESGRGFPAVLQVCGHTLEGKWSYQLGAVKLARRGFAVLAVDPPGQGERDEYADLDTGRRTVMRACRSHGAAGDPAYLAGTNFGAFRLWDCMRWLDYLETRPEIDSRRLGVTGSSGGGWESLWLAALDKRIKAVHSNCYLTTWRRRIEERGRDAEPDPEQDPFGLLDQGLEAADLLLAALPAAVSLGATRRDFFPIDGALKCYAQAKKCYQAAGLADHLGLLVCDAAHQTTPAMRRQGLLWMRRWLMGEKDPWEAPDAGEPEPDLLSSERETFCTRTGVVLTSLGGKITAQLIGEEAARLAAGRAGPRNAVEIKARARTLPGRLKTLLRFRPAGSKLAVREESKARTNGLIVTRLRLNSEEKLRLDAHLWRPEKKGPLPAVVYLAEKDEDYQPLKNPVCRALAAAGVLVLDLDVRGQGPHRETWMDFVPLLEADLCYDALLLGRPLIGQRAADALRGVDYLAGQPEVDASRIGIFGSGSNAVLALFCAGLDRRLSAVFEDRTLASLAALAWHREYAWPVSVIVPDLLRHFDLNDVRAALAPRKLCLNAPLDHVKKIIPPGPPEFSGVRQAYKMCRAASNFVIRSKTSLRKLAEFFI